MCISNRNIHPATVLLLHAALLVCLSFSLSAEESKDSQVVLYHPSGFGVETKSVVSMRDNKFDNLVEQQFDFSCGAAAASTILQYAYNMNVTELDVIMGLSKVANSDIAKQKGYSLLDIRHYVETLGLRGRGFELPISSLVKLRIPTIVLIDTNGYKHFVVLRRIDGDTVFIGDPALGNRVLTKTEFVDMWDGVVFAILGHQFDRQTELRQPVTVLSAKPFLRDQDPITDAELLDFGFSHAEMF